MRSLIAVILAFLMLPTVAFAQAAYSFRDCGTSSATGSSQQLLAGSGFNRKYLLVCNNSSVSTDNVGLNLAGGTASLNATGTLTLVPGACKEFSVTSASVSNPPSTAITAIATSGQPILCIEGK